MQHHQGPHPVSLKVITELGAWPVLPLASGCPRQTLIKTGFVGLWCVRPLPVHCAHHSLPGQRRQGFWCEYGLLLKCLMLPNSDFSRLAV